MKKRVFEARYKTISEEIIKSYKQNQTSSEELDCFFHKKFNSSGNVEKLTGGRVSSVYKINHDGQHKVVKFSTGIYRITELKREAEILKYLINEGYGHIIPDIDDFTILDNFAYLVEDYIDGKAVREELSVNGSVEERQIIWEKVGQVLSEIHMLRQKEDIGDEWLNGQLEIARINMENDLLDTEEFQEEAPEKMLEWLMSNRPRRERVSLLHGDFRTKNIIVDNQNNYKVIDWGFADIGDPFYDLAIIDYYFRDNLDRDCFYRGYNDSKYDEKLIEYYDKLSKFINV